MPTIKLAPKLGVNYLDENPQGVPTVVLLHGLGAASRSWTLQIPVLTGAGFRVIAPDLRGFGESTYPGGGYRIEDLAMDVVSLLKAFGVKNIYLVGLSLGGTVALSMVCDYAQLIQKAMLVNTFARLRPTKPGSLYYYAMRFVLIYTLGLKPQARMVSQRIFPNPEQAELRRLLIEEISHSNSAAYRAAFIALARFNRMASLAQIKTPILVVTGARDTTVPPANQRHLIDGITSAHQVIIPDAGHAVIIDQPQLFNRAMLDFFNMKEICAL
jgi:pimeloyl-ACP methyl ester carboxylesterase